MTMKTYHSDLKPLMMQTCENINHVLHHLGIFNYYQDHRVIVSECPIHKGDNPSALNLYKQGETLPGFWTCNTRGCQKIFKPTILGFVRGVLSSKEGWQRDGDPIVDFGKTIKYVKEILGKEKVDRPNQTKQVQVDRPKLIKRSDIIGRLKIPSPYFLNRGYCENILIKYDVGDCYRKGSERS